MTNSSTKISISATARRIGGLLVSMLAVTALTPGAALASPDPSPAACPDPTSQPFLAYGDAGLYRLAPGGDFEGDLSGYAFRGAAGPVAGSSPIGGDTVISLAPNSSVTTPPLCADGTEQFSRMFSQSIDGNPGADIAVETVLPDGSSRRAGTIHSGDNWAPTGRFRAPVGSARGASSTFQYRFTVMGHSTTLIDGLYVDPRIRG